MPKKITRKHAKASGLTVQSSRDPLKLNVERRPDGWRFRKVFKKRTWVSELYSPDTPQHRVMREAREQFLMWRRREQMSDADRQRVKAVTDPIRSLAGFADEADLFLTNHFDRVDQIANYAKNLQRVIDGMRRRIRQQTADGLFAPPEEIDSLTDLLWKCEDALVSLPELAREHYRMRLNVELQRCRESITENIRSDEIIQAKNARQPADEDA